MTTLALLLGPPLLGALLAVVVKPYRPIVGWANALLSLLSLGAAVALWRGTARKGRAYLGMGLGVADLVVLLAFLQLDDTLSWSL